MPIQAFSFISNIIIVIANYIKDNYITNANKAIYMNFIVDTCTIESFIEIQKATTNLDECLPITIIADLIKAAGLEYLYLNKG